MGQTHQVVFALRSSRDLEAIVRYIAQQSGSEVASQFGARLFEKVLSLKSLPERGRMVPEVGPPYREIIFRSYRIVYRLSGEVVEILRFWHAARGVPQIDSDDFGQPH